jgi:ParB-like chromosome segregation protein Spo0J
VPETITWEGAEALREMLVPVDELAPFPGNPRRGDIEHIRASLRRFGQMKPLLVTSDGTIVAGHHVRLAAIEEGWSHVAVLPHEFADENEARAYLLADNRIADFGSYDQADLVEHLRALAELEQLEGTGYDEADLSALQASLSDGDESPMEIPALPPPPANGQENAREMVLVYDNAQYERLNGWLAVVAKEQRVAGASETVYAAVEFAARMLNQGEA